MFYYKIKKRRFNIAPISFASIISFLLSTTIPTSTSDQHLPSSSHYHHPPISSALLNCSSPTFCFCLLFQSSNKNKNYSVWYVFQNIFEKVYLILGSWSQT